MEDCSCGVTLTCIGACCKACVYSQIGSMELSCEAILQLKASLHEGQVCLKCYKVKLTKLKMSEMGEDLVFACPQCKSVEATMSTVKL
mmetsp:Transcript_13211/g.24732  ORF Transcript_13211/g.24732 Transcript_13211/m.24732 type:complete len:88 (+) Transcript_13211:641-904(+)